VCKGTNTPWASTAYSAHAVSGGFSVGSSIKTYSGCSTTASGLWTTGLDTAPLPIVVSVVAQMENTLKCAGICDYSWFYVFTDVSLGVPSNSCVDAFLTLVTDNVIIIIIAGAGLAVSQLLGIIGSFMICCSDNSYCCGTGCIDPEAIN
jgi:hypothetical protein